MRARRLLGAVTGSSDEMLPKKGGLMEKVVDLQAYSSAWEKRLSK